MKVLALDIGAGTEDILLYDDEKSRIENCVKMVLPSPSQVLAVNVRRLTRLHKDIFVRGDIIGGGAFSFALRNHVKQGYRVVMTENAAYTVRNDLDEVRALGIEITKEGNAPRDFVGETMSIAEVNLLQLKSFMSLFGEDLSDVGVVAVAVQDHGFSPKGIRNRKFRVKKMQELLTGNSKPEALAFVEEEIPPIFLRMKSAVLALKKQMPNVQALLMDTCPAAILGCLKDPLAENVNPILAINVGNGHTMAALISNENIVGVMEHHTGLLTPRRIEHLLIEFANGNLSDEEVFKSKGHGLFFLTKPPGFSKIQKIIATGPNRRILDNTNLPVHYAAPIGDVMMAGPLGLVEATNRNILHGSITGLE